jgi:citrate synthase
MAKTEQILDYEQISNLAQLCLDNSSIDPALYERYNVKRGLRDINGKGVLSGLTKISYIESSKVVDGKDVPCDGRLFYRGIDIRDLVNGFLADDRPGFEETAYLLLFGKLPNP